MTHRERWLKSLHFEPVEHVPDIEFGYWDEVFPIWHQQGLPKEIDNNGKADVFFGFAPSMYFPVHHSLLPSFERRVLEEGPDYRKVQDSDGATYMEHTSRQSSIPHFLNFALKDRESWETLFKPRLDPDSPGRRDAEGFAPNREARAQRDYPLGINIGSLYGWLRGWAGFEGGWIPHVDHRVPPDVTYDNYLFYLEYKREKFGIPTPAPWEERRPADW